MPDQNHLYLVDGSSYIFRAYHRLPPLTNRHGVPAGAVYGYTAMLWKLADGLNKADGPTHMAVILDASEHTFRNEMYDQYKAHRPPPPEDLVPQFPLIRTATRAFSIPCIETAGLEVLVPDLVGWRRERLPEMPKTAAFHVAPDWVCETLSPSTETVDRERKMAIYARETGQGMALPDDVHAAGEDGDLDSDIDSAEEGVTTTLSAVPSDPTPEGDDDGPPSPTPTPRRGGHLRIVK